MQTSLPILDLELLAEPGIRGDSARASLRRATRELGVFHLRAPSLSAARIAESLASMSAFFDLDLEAKARVAQLSDSPTGYAGLEASNGSFESFFSVPARASAFGWLNRWPVEIPALEAQTLRHIAELDEIGRTLMRAMAEDLGFPAALTAHALGADCGGSLRALRYPAGVGAGDPREYKPSHTDMCALALQVVSAPGLEVDAGVGWLPVDCETDTLIVLVGALMPFWSGGRYVACRHRVVATNTAPRTSLCYFFQPALDTLIEPIGPHGRIGDRDAKPLGALMDAWQATREVPTLSGM